MHLAVVIHAVLVTAAKIRLSDDAVAEAKERRGRKKSGQSCSQGNETLLYV